MNKTFNEKQLVIDLRQLGEAVGSGTTYFAGPIFVNGTKVEVESTDRSDGKFGEEGTSLISTWITKRLIEEGVCTQEDIDECAAGDDYLYDVDCMCVPGKLYVIEWNGKNFVEVAKPKKVKPTKKDRYAKLLGLMTSVEFREWVISGGLLSDEASGKAVEKLKEFGF